MSAKSADMDVIIEKKLSLLSYKYMNNIIIFKWCLEYVDPYVCISKHLTVKAMTELPQYSLIISFN